MQLKKIAFYSFFVLSSGVLYKQAQAGLLENDIYYEDQPRSSYSPEGYECTPAISEPQEIKIALPQEQKPDIENK